MSVRIRHPEKLVYPESDGKPMGENTLQFQWIHVLFHEIEKLFFARDDVFVAGDLFWYPLNGDPTTVQAPDIMVAFGRPKGHRKSYKQWNEGGVAPQVVFEVRSPSNTADDVTEMRKFYRRYGVEEFYLYDPEHGEFEAWTRSGKKLVPVAEPHGFVSPRMGVTFETPDDGPLRLIRPDGRPFLTYREIITKADEERERADQAVRLAEHERREKEAARREADALAAKLRELGVDPDTVC